MNRVILVSDMHYTTEDLHLGEDTPGSNIRPSLASGPIFGHSQREKVSCVYNDIMAFHQAAAVDAALVLGDLSIDDYSYRNLPINYCLQMKEDCLSRWPFPVFCLPGNHDSYPNDSRQPLFGTPRQYVAHIGGAAFVMLDTFQKLPATDASGAGYTGADILWLKTQLQEIPESRIFLCAHHLNEDAEKKLFSLMEQDRRIVCAFRGHTHINAVLHPAGEKPLVDIGGYGYNGQVVDGQYTFAIFSPAWAWGYEVLEWDEKKVHLYHVKPCRHYNAGNGEFDIPYTVEDELILP